MIYVLCMRRKLRLLQKHDLIQQNPKSNNMKKAVLFLTFLAFALGTQAQIDLGPKIGYTTTKLSVDQSNITTDLKNNFLFGAFVRLGKKVYIQPEINWYTSGGVFKRPTIGSLSPFEQEIKMRNIQIPVFIGVRLLDLKLISLRAAAGPTANIVMNKTIESNQGSGYIDPIKEADINNLNWGFQFGAGVDVLMFTLDVQYMLGLNNVIGDVKVGGESIKFDSKKNGFVVSLGWKIF